MLRGGGICIVKEKPLLRKLVATFRLRSALHVHAGFPLRGAGVFCVSSARAYSCLGFTLWLSHISR